MPHRPPDEPPRPQPGMPPNPNPKPSPLIRKDLPPFPTTWIVLKSVTDKTALRKWQHVEDQAEARTANVADRVAYRDWAESRPLVPRNTLWYKRFNSICVVGKGDHADTTLAETMAPREGSVNLDDLYPPPSRIQEWYYGAVRYTKPKKAKLLQKQAAAADIPAIVREFMGVLEPGLPVPVIKVVNHTGSRWLGRDIYDPKLPGNTKMELQKSIVGDDKTLRRILAHECCHHQDFLVNWEPLSPADKRTERFLRRDGHGPQWQAIAALFNARYGADFVTRTSDEAMVVEGTNEFFVLMRPKPGAAGTLWFSMAVRPSPKQKKRIEDAVAAGGRLFRSKDSVLAHAPKIGDGWGSARPTDTELKEKLQRIWDEGEQVPVKTPDTSAYEDAVVTAYNALMQERAEKAGQAEPDNGSVPAPKEAAKPKGKLLGVESPEFKAWFSGSHVVNEDGSPCRVFRGDYRGDRIGPAFKKHRNTSGRFYFTSDPEIASSYATNKPDAQHQEENQDYANWFRFPKYKSKGERNAPDLKQLWWRLNEAERARVKHVIENTSHDDQSELQFDSGHGIAGNMEEYGRRARGNWLAVAEDLWLTSGAIFDEEEKFGKLLDAMGLDYEFDNPHEARSMVTAVYLKITNPLDTSNIPSNVVNRFRELVKGTRTKYKPGDAQWDKGNYSVRDWVDKLEEDLKDGTTYAWTVMPEKITQALQQMGYDGVKDTGGKMGGDKHIVWIAFEPHQIKSATGNKGKYDSGKDSIIASRKNAMQVLDHSGDGMIEVEDPKTPYDKACCTVALDDEMWHMLVDYVSCPDGFDDNPKAYAKLIALIKKIPPFVPPSSRGCLYRGEPFRPGDDRLPAKWEGSHRPVLSWSLNYDTAKYFADGRDAIVWCTVGKIKGIALGDIVHWRNITHQGESHYSGSQAEWFVLSTCKAKEARPPNDKYAKLAADHATRTATRKRATFEIQVQPKGTCDAAERILNSVDPEEQVVLFHSSSRPKDKEIRTDGLRAQIGDWVNEVLNGATDDEEAIDSIRQSAKGLVYFDKLPRWIVSQVSRRLKNKSHDEVTRADIMAYGQLCIVVVDREYSGIRRYLGEPEVNRHYPTVEDMSGRVEEFHEHDDYFGLEPGDYFSEEDVMPAITLVGKELVKFLNKHYPQVMETGHHDWDDDRDAINSGAYFDPQARAETETRRENEQKEQMGQQRLFKRPNYGEVEEDSIHVAKKAKLLQKQATDQEDRVEFIEEYNRLPNLAKEGIIPEDHLTPLLHNPPAQVTIYRAVPPGITEIRPGDWVALDRAYAQTHDRGGDILQMVVPAIDVAWAGSDMNEFLYVPVKKAKLLQKQAAFPSLKSLMSHRDTVDESVGGAWKEMVEEDDPAELLERYNRVVSNFDKFSFPLTVYRAVHALTADDVSLSGVGVYWAMDLDHAIAHNADYHDEGRSWVIEADVASARDIDWAATIVANLVLPQEREIRLKAGAELKLLSIIDDTGNDVESGDMDTQKRIPITAASAPTSEAKQAADDTARYGPEQYTVDECVSFAYQNEAQTAYENGVRGDAQTEAALQGLISNWEYYADEYRVPYDVFKAELKRRDYWEEPAPVVPKKRRPRKKAKLLTKKAANEQPESGPYGPIFHEFTDKPMEAIEKLISEKGGEVPGVWYHPVLGWIDLIWGNEEGGLAHIIAKHVEGQKDLKLIDLAEMIPYMKVVRRDGMTARLESADHEAGVKLEYFGEAKRWLVTAYEKPKKVPIQGSILVLNSKLAPSDGHPPSGTLNSVLHSLKQAAAVRGISLQEARDRKLFGPVYHGTTEGNRETINQEGFKYFEEETGSASTSHGYGTSEYAQGAPPPIHHLGFGVYLTTSKAIATKFNGGSARGLTEYYIDAPNMATINFGAPNTMMKWWVANGYDAALAKTDRVAATRKLTEGLKSKYEAVWFKGKGIRRLLDGDQVVVFDPDRIYKIDKGLSQPGDIGCTVIRKADGMKGVLVGIREMGEQFRQYHGGAERFLEVKWQKGGRDANVYDRDVEFPETKKKATLLQKQATPVTEGLDWRTPVAGLTVSLESLAKIEPGLEDMIAEDLYRFFGVTEGVDPKRQVPINWVEPSAFEPEDFHAGIAVAQKVEAIADLMAQGHKFSPAFSCKNMWRDGNHRVKAAARIGALVPSIDIHSFLPDATQAERKRQEEQKQRWTDEDQSLYDELTEPDTEPKKAKLLCAPETEKLRVAVVKIALNIPNIKKLFGKKMCDRYRSENVWAKQKTDDDVFEGMMDTLEGIDPSPTKEYVFWAASNFAKGTIRRFEDMAWRVMDSLKRFDALKRSKALPVEQRDIMKLKGLNALEELVDQYKEVETTSNREKDTQIEKDFFKSGDALLIYNDAEMKVVVPKTQEASCYFGVNTKWCTAAKEDNMFSRYAEHGDLYIVLFKAENKRYQFNFETSQFMDEKDEPINALELADKHPILWKVFSPIAEKLNSVVFNRNPSVEIQIKSVRRDPFTIRYIKNPAEVVQQNAADRSGQVLQFIADPSDNVQFMAIRENANSIKYIQNPSEARQLQALERDLHSYRWIEQPAEKATMYLVKTNPLMLKIVAHPSEEVQMAAVELSGDTIQYIDDPSEEVQLASLGPTGRSLTHIKWPSEAVQLAGVSRNGMLIGNVGYSNGEKLFEPSEAVQLAAVKQNGRAIQFLKNPSPAVQEASRQALARSLEQPEARKAASVPGCRAKLLQAPDTPATQA